MRPLASQTRLPEMANLVWKKEPDGDKYVDLFENFEQYKYDFEIQFALLRTNVKCEPYAREYIRMANIEFTAEQYMEAIRLYNRALCFAVPDTETMAVAYLYRAHCFNAIGKSDCAMSDVHTAKAMRHISKSMHKQLEIASNRIVGTLMSNRMLRPFAPKLSYKSHADDETVANVLGFERGGYRGYRIVTTCNLSPGQLVHRGTELIKSAIMAPNQMMSRCSYCGCDFENTKPCEKCSFTMICPDKACNKAHATECFVPPTAVMDKTVIFKRNMLNVKRTIDFAMDLFDNVKKLIKFFEEVVQCQDEEPPCWISAQHPREQYRAFLKLYKGPSRQFRKEHAEVYACILNFKSIRIKFQKEADARFLQHLVGYHMSIVNQLQSMSLYGNYLDYSCAPNTTVVLADGKVHFFIIRPIAAGQPLTIGFNHWEWVLDDDIRMSRLRFCGVSCKCERCSWNGFKLAESPLRSDPTFLMICKQFRYQMSLEHARELEPHFINLMSKYGGQWTRELQGLHDMYHQLMANIISVGCISELE